MKVPTYSYSSFSRILQLSLSREFKKTQFITRMHSSRMRTAHSLTISHRKKYACPLEQPCTPPRATMHAPRSNHACPPGATTHAPRSNHAHPPRSNHACPPRSNHTRPPTSNHAHPPLWTE